MNGKFIKKCQFGKVIEEYNFNGRFVMTYNGLDLHIGDIIQITDDFGSVCLPTFVMNLGEDGFTFYKFEKYVEDGWIDENRIIDISIVKRFDEIETGYFVRGLKAHIYQYDISTIIKNDKLDKQSLDKSLSIEYRMELLQMMINSHLSSNPSKEDMKNIIKWNKEYLLLKSIKEKNESLKFS